MNAGFDEWLSGLGEGEGYYLACPDGHGSLPPRRTCPHCGATELTEEPLPETGTIETYTEVHVSAPDFADQTPYVTAIVSFGPVRLTGVYGGFDSLDQPPSVGATVTVETAPNPKRGDPVVVFSPQ
jgi:uncharacterized OB-fold protein